MDIRKHAVTLIGVVGLAGIIILAYWDFPITNAPDKNPEKQQTGTIIEDKTITNRTSPFAIDITYPYIAGASDFNTIVQAFIDQNVNDFKETALENDQAIRENDPIGYAENPRTYDYLLTYEKGQVDENIISVALDISSYTGGAHGAHYIKSFNWNVKEKKEVKLADMFPNDPNYLQKISPIAIAELTKQINQRAENSADVSWINDGAGPKTENYSTFLINKDRITFYFAEYQVAAYAFGDFTVTIPR